MEHKRAQLRQLSQSLQACSTVEPPTAPMPTEASVIATEQVTAGDLILGDAADVVVDAAHPDSEPQPALCSAEVAKPDVVTGYSPSPPIDTDPMARLNAIKLRLAKQIENH
ncbi:MAG: hypothetical protein ACO1RT_00335 [Planctomycetaceae bacterium]